MLPVRLLARWLPLVFLFSSPFLLGGYIRVHIIAGTRNERLLVFSLLSARYPSYFKSTAMPKGNLAYILKITKKRTGCRQCKSYRRSVYNCNKGHTSMSDLVSQSTDRRTEMEMFTKVRVSVMNHVNSIEAGIRNQNIRTGIHALSGPSLSETCFSRFPGFGY